MPLLTEDQMRLIGQKINQVDSLRNQVKQTENQLTGLRKQLTTAESELAILNDPTQSAGPAEPAKA